MWKSAIERMEKHLPSTVVNSGWNTQLMGGVLSVRMSDGLLKARVKGETSRIFTVHLDLKNWPATPSTCSCQVYKNCEHAVAALYFVQNKNSTTAPADEKAGYPLQETAVLNAEEVEWFSNVQEPGQQFFSYQLGILIDGKPVSIVPLVIELISRWDAKTLETLSDDVELKLPIGEGKILKITLERLKPLLRLLLQYSFKDSNSVEALKLKRYQLVLMHEAEKALSATSARWQGTESVRDKLHRLSDLKDIPETPVPQGLNTTLRSYQQEGLNWLQCLRANDLNGVLADDMGLGKTIQTLTLLQYEKEQGRMKKPSLIVAPTSLMGNWYEEAKRFTPNLNVLVFHGTERHADSFEAYDVVLSTYGLIHRDKRLFLKQLFYYLILDEAQFIKNARTKTTQVIQQLHGEHRLCLTGTPLENHLGELWSLFHFLMPGFLGTAQYFRQTFRTPIEKEADAQIAERLAQRLQPFMLRRTKKGVVHELPPKTEMTRMIELSGQQRDLYEGIRLTMEKKVREAIAKQGVGKSHIMLLDALLKLRQICCDPRLLSLSAAEAAHGHSAKLDALLNLLDNLMEEGRNVLVFSQFTSMLKLIEDELVKRGYPYLKLTGQSTNRMQLVKDFQTGKAPIFLISLKAGGIGLNLTRADTVIHYDPWWNPAVEDQATDRSHRIGQENPVFVYKLIAEGTVEEVILRMQNQKRQLVHDLLQTPSSGKLILSKQEIESLFEISPQSTSL